MKSLLLVISLIFTFNFAQAENVKKEVIAVTDVSAEVQAVGTPALLPENELAKLEADFESQLTSEKDLAEKTEAEIPVQLEAPAKIADTSSHLGRAMAAVAIFSVLGIGAFLYVRRNAKPNAKNQQTQIKVLTQHWLGPKKQLSIIRVAGETILIGITDSQISHIKTLSLVDEEIPEDVPANFNGAMKKFDVQESEDEFAISGLRDFVSKKLKGMRTLE